MHLSMISAATFEGHTIKRSWQGGKPFCSEQNHFAHSSPGFSIEWSKKESKPAFWSGTFCIFDNGMKTAARFFSSSVTSACRDWSQICRYEEPDPS